MDLELSDADARILRDILADYLPGLRVEAARTEGRAMRHLIVERQETCERVLSTLDAALGTGQKPAVPATGTGS